MSMRVAVLSYPMLFQSAGGLQIQIRETIEALRVLGIDVTLMNPVEDRLTDYDLVHVFSAINGNHRMVETAKAFGVPTIASPLLQPHWTRSFGRRTRLLEAIAGRLTGWDLKTEYAHILSCLSHSDLLLALSSSEKRCMVEVFGIAPQRVEVVPNGIPARFFKATPELFLEKAGIEAGFVLNVGSISPDKNQLGLVQAVNGRWPVVLIGAASGAHRDYLSKVCAAPRVHYLGPLKYADPLLPSAYAAAGVFCLPSQSEVMPLSVLEALAAGTRVVVTRNHAMDTDSFQRQIEEVHPNNPDEIADAIDRMLSLPRDRHGVSETVKTFTWEAVGAALLSCYQRALEEAPRR